MRMMKSLLAAALISLSAMASAATITVTWNNPVFNPAGVDVGTINFPPSGSIATSAGRFEGTVTATNGISPSELYQSPTDFFAYCHELSQTLSSGTYTVGTASAVMLDFLGAVNSVLGNGVFSWLSPGNSTIAAAVQLGIWEALHNDDFILDMGLVRVNPANVPDAVEAQFALFANARLASDSLSSSHVMVLTNPDTQDVITGRRVPEPGTLLLLGFAAAAAGLARRRRR